MSGGIDENSGLPRGYPFRSDWEVTPRQLAAELASDRPPMVIDCRTPQERDVAAIPGSTLIPMGDIPSRENELDELVDRRVVVYCHRGQRSLRVTAFLRQRGFSDVWSLAGGIDAWSSGVDPTVPRY